MKVLIAEDDPVSRRVLEVTLANWGYSVTVVSDGTEALRLLGSDDGPRIAILDWMMPGLDGVDVCKHLRTNAADRYVYIILLTSRQDKSDLAVGIEAGADDYITKPFESVELKARLLAGSRIIQLEKALYEAREQLRHQAMHDSLTGLWNRAAILDRLDGELTRAKRQGTSVAIVMADIDRFKEINDTHGHPTGDSVLRQVALRLSSGLRTYDSVGRYGGEEFLIVLPNCDSATAGKLALRLCEACRENEHSVTCSFGVVASQPDCLDSQRLIAIADAALYRAKGEGRDRVIVGEITD
jgi:diguanylate cyclase (GGDEF)-like protein